MKKKSHRLNRWLTLWGFIEEFVLDGANRACREGRLDDDDWRELLELAKIEFETPGMFNRVLPEEDKGETMLQQLVLYKQAGKVIPLNVLGQAINQFDKYEGKSAAIEGAVHTSRAIGKSDASALYEQLQTIAQFPAVICLGKSETAADNIPPFEMFDGAMVIFLQDETHILPKIVAKFNRELKNCGGKFGDLWTELCKEDSEIAPEIENLLTENGAVIILSAGGGVFVSDRGGLEEEHEEWGYSYSLKPADGGKEDPKPAPVAQPTAPKVSFGATTVPKEPSPAVEAVKTGEQLLKNRPAKYEMARIHERQRHLFSDKYAPRINHNGTVSFVNEKEFFYQSPEYETVGNGFNKKLTKDDHKKNYERVCGWLPENYKERPLVPAGFLLKKTAGPEDSTATAALEINQEPVKTPSPNLDKDAAKELVSVIWPKLSGVHHQIMGNIHKISEMEGEVKSVAHHLDKKTMAECSLPYAARYQIAAESPLIAARWWGDYQTAYADMMTRNGLLENRVAELELELEEAKKPKKIVFGSTAK